MREEGREEGGLSYDEERGFRNEAKSRGKVVRQSREAKRGVTRKPFCGAVVSRPLFGLYRKP